MAEEVVEGTAGGTDAPIDPVQVITLPKREYERLKAAAGENPIPSDERRFFYTLVETDMLSGARYEVLHATKIQDDGDSVTLSDLQLAVPSPQAANQGLVAKARRAHGVGD